ncbi:uncharacterized protein LOC117190779 [Drosophila miranda]|uniref:uncharacterized protein LOC117190779 n=1 Tax=Drosophila miranda TaxID=7229 RepID=UPI00143F4734|nr:uncharacterized protein LOC117190779 [Drosophila miranda]
MSQYFMRSAACFPGHLSPEGSPMPLYPVVPCEWSVILTNCRVDCSTHLEPPSLAPLKPVPSPLCSDCSRSDTLIEFVPHYPIPGLFVLPLSLLYRLALGPSSFGGI